MKTTGREDRNERPMRQATASHQFTVGQQVRLKDGFLMSTAKSTNTYHVTATLPPRGDVPQYRIRNDSEPHERVTTENSLEAVDMTEARANATLIELTFGKGPKTATPPPTEPESEAADHKGVAQKPGTAD